MGFRCGIVGLPNVGKSTLFNALTRAGVAAENFPFCTIDPSVGVAPVSDARLDAIAEIVKPEKVVPTACEFVDIAGLVKGASRGEGLGNQFLANIRETDAIIHVVRCFENSDIAHVSDRIDPLADVETINTELLLADLESVEKSREKAVRTAKNAQRDDREIAALLEVVYRGLSDGKAVREMDLDDSSRGRLKPFHLLSAKPVLYVANVAEDGSAENAGVVAEFAAAAGAGCLRLCNRVEAELITLEGEELREMLGALGMKDTGLSRLVRSGYELLGLRTFFTAGPKEVRAWTIPRGATAPSAAGRIHGDFERGFIRAEVVSAEDFLACGGEAGARGAGKMRLEGKEYIVNDGDVIHFRHNT